MGKQWYQRYTGSARSVDLVYSSVPQYFRIRQGHRLCECSFCTCRQTQGLHLNITRDTYRACFALSIEDSTILLSCELSYDGLGSTIET